MADRGEGRPAMHVVYGLVDASGNLGLVSWRNVNSPAAWRAVWVARSALPGHQQARGLDARAAHRANRGDPARFIR